MNRAESLPSGEGVAQAAVVCGLWAEPEERNRVEVGMRLPVAELAPGGWPASQVTPSKGTGQPLPCLPNDSRSFSPTAIPGGEGCWH